MNNQDNKNMQNRDELLLAMVEKLPEQHRKVVEMKFGRSGAPMSDEAIAKELDLPVEKVQELEAEALRILRHPSR